MYHFSSRSSKTNYLSHKYSDKRAKFPDKWSPREALRPSPPLVSAPLGPLVRTGFDCYRNTRSANHTQPIKYWHTFSSIDRWYWPVTNTDNWARLSSFAVETWKCDFLIQITLNNSVWFPCEDDVIFIHDVIDGIFPYWAANSWYAAKGDMRCCVCRSTGWVSQCYVGVERCVEVKCG